MAWAADLGKFWIQERIFLLRSLVHGRACPSPGCPFFFVQTSEEGKIMDGKIIKMGIRHDFAPMILPFLFFSNCAQLNSARLRFADDQEGVGHCIHALTRT